jgi:hypothetical protein
MLLKSTPVVVLKTAYVCIKPTPLDVHSLIRAILYGIATLKDVVRANTHLTALAIGERMAASIRQEHAHNSPTSSSTGENLQGTTATTPTTTHTHTVDATVPDGMEREEGAAARHHVPAGFVREYAAAKAVVTAAAAAEAIEVAVALSKGDKVTLVQLVNSK